MVMTESADLGKLISDAKHEAQSRKLPALVYLLGLAEIEFAKTGVVPARPDEKPKKRRPSGHRRGS
jgi:hypothetical protein